MEDTHAGEFLNLGEMRLENLGVLMLEVAVELYSNVSKCELPCTGMK